MNQLENFYLCYRVVRWIALVNSAIQGYIKYKKIKYIDFCFSQRDEKGQDRILWVFVHSFFTTIVKVNYYLH
jgi:hypothetical protein